ncbi:hypothetical protein N7454_005391 [Penicillium verhagenii]|nr:hypothetical protein N7454_005391 [Penicillium verhagenii]
MTSSTKTTAITNARVFNGTSFSEPTTITITGPLISSAEQTPTHTFDAKGAFLLPGLIDAHIHLSGPDDLATMARNGITTALDMATWPIERLTALRNQKGLTDIRGCGLAACGPGSAHSHIPGRPDDAIVASPAQGRRFVLDRLAEAADYIKIVADVPGPTQETLDAMVGAAHEHGKLVIAHAVTVEATRMAQAAGVDIVTHAPVDGLMSGAEVAEMVEARRVSVPTLTMMKGVCARRGADYAVSRMNVAALYRAGVVVLAGTDSNRAPGVPAAVEHGVSLHEELELLVECGLSTCEVLRAATCLTADVFGLRDRGRIQPGLRADLLLVDADPLEDIKATRGIVKVWLAGQEYPL